MGYCGGVGAWRSLVARTVRVGEVPSSNLGAPIVLENREQLRTRANIPENAGHRGSVFARVRSCSLVWRPQTDRSGRQKGPQKDRSGRVDCGGHSRHLPSTQQPVGSGQARDHECAFAVFALAPGLRHEVPEGKVPQLPTTNSLTPRPRAWTATRRRYTARLGRRRPNLASVWLCFYKCEEVARLKVGRWRQQNGVAIARPELDHRPTVGEPPL